MCWFVPLVIENQKKKEVITLVYCSEPWSKPRPSSYSLSWPFPFSSSVLAANTAHIYPLRKTIPLYSIAHNVKKLDPNVNIPTPIKIECTTRLIRFYFNVFCINFISLRTLYRIFYEPTDSFISILLYSEKKNIFCFGKKKIFIIKFHNSKKQVVLELFISSTYRFWIRLQCPLKKLYRWENQGQLFQFMHRKHT